MLVGSAYCTFLACAFRQGWVAWGLVTVTVGLLLWASSYRGRRLFVTPDPELHPVGSMWRRYRVVSVEPVGAEGFWLVRGEKAY